MNPRTPALLRSLFLVTLCLSVGAVSCSDSRDAAPDGFLAQSKAPGATLASFDQDAAGRAEQAAGDLAALPSLLAGRKLIRDAALEIEVETVADASRDAASIAERNGGVLADSEFFQNADGQQRATIRLRIPSERFDIVLADLRPLGTVRSERTNAQDVTKAYADLEIRLAVKRETADRLRDILDHRTGTLADVLQVERELARVIEEIERMEGEKRYYDQRIAVSTVSVELYEPGMGAPGPFAAIGAAFGSALRVLSQSVALLVYAATFLVPWLLVATFAGWVILRARRRLTA
jgi:hypothetical protein